MDFLERWTFAWGVAWLTMLTVVLTAAPFIQRAVRLLFEHGPT